MAAFRILLVVMLGILAVYTAIVQVEYGSILFQEFFGAIGAMTWQGQFNTDFSGYLILSGLWYAWRHHFTGQGIVLGIFGFFLGMMMLIPYLLIVSFRSNGNMVEMLIGPQRAAALRN